MRSRWIVLCLVAGCFSETQVSDLVGSGGDQDEAGDTARGESTGGSGSEDSATGTAGGQSSGVPPTGSTGPATNDDAETSSDDGGQDTGAGGEFIVCNAADQSECPLGCAVDTYQDHDYVFCGDAPEHYRKWTTARSACHSMRGDLVRVETEEENAYLTLSAANPFVVFETAWIGANDRSAEGGWVWGDDASVFWSGDVNGSVATDAFANWASTEPNNTGVVGEEDYGAFRTSDSVWYDLSCESTSGYICEIPPR